MSADRHFVAVDLGGTRLRVALADNDLHLLVRRDQPTELIGGPDAVVGQIVRLAEEVLREGGLGWEDVTCLAVASPGPLDSRTGVVQSPPNLPGWEDVPLQRLLQERTGVPVRVVNDANAAALGEYYYGTGGGTGTLVYLTVSTGVGGGVVIDGRLLEGATGGAGEIGHTTIDFRGPRCNCGNIGCVEAFASGTGIARRFAERRAAGEGTSLTGEAVTAAQVAAAAVGGDALAAAVFREAAEALGYGVVNCINTFNPDVVAIGGGVSAAGEMLFAPVRQVVAERALPAARRQARIVPAALGEDVGLIGAAAVGRVLSQNVADTPIIHDAGVGRDRR